MFGLVETIRISWRKRRGRRNLETNLGLLLVSELERHGTDPRLETFTVGPEEPENDERAAAVAAAAELMNGEAWDTPESFERLRALLAEMANNGERMYLTRDETRCYAMGCARERIVNEARSRISVLPSCTTQGDPQ